MRSLYGLCVAFVQNNEHLSLLPCAAELMKKSVTGYNRAKRQAKQKNGIFLVIDGLRYDVISDLKHARKVTPNLAYLAEQGSVSWAVANAQATQFVLPALFSLTYPLDHGGYNNGIRHRPRSYAEQLSDAGYSTQMMASCNVLGITHGYDRGFSDMHTAMDSRVILAHLIGRNLQYELKRWKNGDRSKREIVSLLQNEFVFLLQRVASISEGGPGITWSSRLRKINEKVAAGCRAEINLFEHSADTVIEKMMTIPPVLYWRYLGLEKPGFGYRFWRVLEAVRWRSERFFAKYNFPLLFLAQFETKADEVMGPLSDFITRNDGPWSVHLHLMDLHDCRSLSRPSHIFKRLITWPRWVWLRMKGKTKRRASYDTALMLIDREIGRLIDALRSVERFDDTVIVITGDHGNFYAGSPRKRGNVALRTHFEDIDIPLIMSGCGALPKNIGLVDSMGITATYLDALGITAHESFKGVSAFDGGCEAVITESAGSGNADLENRDLYFTVTTHCYRMMSVLIGSQLKILGLFDKRSDPDELLDLSKDPKYAEVMSQLRSYLEKERTDILAMRGYSQPEQAYSNTFASAR